MAVLGRYGLDFREFLKVRCEITKPSSYSLFLSPFVQLLMVSD